MIETFTAYIQGLGTVQNHTEHSGRTYLQNMLKTLTDVSDISIIQEPKRDADDRGAPDFRFDNQDTVIGFLENKKIGDNLNAVLKSEQIKKYKSLTDNLIVTDYLRWIWIFEGNVVRDVTLCTPSDLNVKNFTLDSKKCESVQELITDFLSQTPQMIAKAQELAEKLSKPTRVIKKEIEYLLKHDTDKKRIHTTFDAFQQEISEHITPDEFADAFAQTFTYSLFLTKITLTGADKLTLENIEDFIPQSFSLIKDILLFIKEINKYPDLKPYISCILHIINHTDSYSVIADLQTTKDEFEDPYIHFYENFLTAYDKQKRKDLGVWYTPKPIVKSIISMIDDILKDDFGMADGLASESEHLKILDFACGTGTFLQEIYEQILDNIPADSLKRKRLIQNHILKNIYGFELLIPAYTVAHLKLSQYLKYTHHYELSDDERIPVYFTNTLEEKKEKQKNLAYAQIFPAMTAEGIKAQEIKDDRDILVITGNPPYNVKSKNIIDGDLKKFHESYKPKDEKNINSLGDDYIKFIAFAHQKIKLSGRGVFGLIVNNSFLSGLTHRTMRNKLLADFDKIYVINLYGGGTINDIRDENVFAIKQNVCIAIFVKNDTIRNKGLYYHELIGKRLDKFKALGTLTRQDFTPLKIDEFNKNFRKTSWGKNRFADDLSFFYPMQNDKLLIKYGKFIGLTDIFESYTTGVQTANDKKLISFEIKDFKEKIDKFDDTVCRNIMYRPFDKRKVYYDTELIDRPRLEVMRHILDKKNIGLCFIRNDYKTEDYNFAFISEMIIDRHLLGGQAYFAPLYLYSDDLDSQKRVNFKPEFMRMIKSKLNNSTPEQILSYIYAIMHIPHYRTDYLEYLKIDFPRIPFDISQEYFDTISRIGQDLIDAHILKKIPISNIGEPCFRDVKNQNMVVEHIEYNATVQRLYFNKECYFADISPSVWDFKIDGYQVLDKYLKARNNIDITDMLTDTQNIIKALDFTIKTSEILDKFEV